jgi:formiminoglutamate deiminase
VRYFAEHAWLGSGLASNVLIQVEGGRFTAITPNSDQRGADHLPGLVLPGFANAHSHAFHRALRGRTQDGRGSFWTWRERMYAIAAQLDPDQYLALATATYAEMALAGVTSVGEFHYLHHAPGGTPYRDPNAMGEVLREAAKIAGIRLTLLDTCYLAGGLSAQGHLPLDEVQRRFSDGTAAAWVERVAELKADDQTIIGAAIHSVRAVPKAELGRVKTEGPLHIHVSEQPAENQACLDYYGLSPVGLLAAENVLGSRTTAVHATHLGRGDVALLGDTRTGVCFCPTTERDLADGIGPAAELHQAGVALSLGSDQHAVIDLLEEARALEMHERLASLQRGRFTVAEIIESLTEKGHQAIGWHDTGRIEVGMRADLVAVRLDTVRTAGVNPDQAVLAATAADVDTVIVDGRTVVRNGEHVLGDVGAMLNSAIAPLW